MRVFFYPKQAMKNFLKFFQFSGCKPPEKVYNKKAVREKGRRSGDANESERHRKKVKKDVDKGAQTRYYKQATPVREPGGALDL